VNEHKKLIKKFYSSFSKGNSAGMAECYHENVTFEDPVFGKLSGSRASKMWHMLLEKGKGNLKINFDSISSHENTGSVNWTAEYFYGPRKRPVTNKVRAKFEFKDGKIIKHVDDFNLYKWTQQAMGGIGYALGWTPFFKKKIRKTVNSQLDRFIDKNS